MQALLPPFPDGSPRAPADEGRGDTSRPRASGPTVSPSTPHSRPTFPPKPGGLGMPRVLEGRPAYSPPASSAWQLLGAEGGPRPTQELWDKGRQGSLLPCWGRTQPRPSTQATTDDPLHNSIGGGGWGLATLTQPTFGFQERKKDRVCYFPATHSSFLCDVCTVRHTRYKKYIHASLMGLSPSRGRGKSTCKVSPQPASSSHPVLPGQGEGTPGARSPATWQPGTRGRTSRDSASQGPLPVPKGHLLGVPISATCVPEMPPA